MCFSICFLHSPVQAGSCKPTLPHFLPTSGDDRASLGTPRPKTADNSDPASSTRSNVGGGEMKSLGEDCVGEEEQPLRPGAACCTILRRFGSEIGWNERERLETSGAGGAREGEKKCFSLR